MTHNCSPDESIPNPVQKSKLLVELEVPTYLPSTIGPPVDWTDDASNSLGRRLVSSWTLDLSPSCRNIWEMIAKFAGEIIYSHKDNLYCTVLISQLGLSRICDSFFLPHSSEGIGLDAG